MTVTLPFPYRLPTVTNIAPFTYREGSTYLQILEALRVYVNDLIPQVDARTAILLNDFQLGLENSEATVTELIADVDARIMTINNRVGPESIQRLTLTTDHTLTVDPVWPDAHPIRFQYRQDGTGGRAVTLGAGITGTLVLDPAPGALTEFELVPDGTGWIVEQVSALYVGKGERTVNPKDFSGSDTARLLAAATVANVAGLPLEVSEALTIDGNIPNFWNVHPSGTGSITRAGNTFRLTPRPDSAGVPTNTVYVNAATGNDNNDGLSSAYPLKTLSKLYSGVLRRLTADQAAGASWVVQLAGAFPEGLKMEDLPEFPHELVFQGEPLVALKPVTSILMGTGASKVGIWIEPGRSTVVVNNILFKDFKESGTGYALLMKGGGTIAANDCAAENCDIGFAAIRNVDFTFTRCTTNETVPAGFNSQYSSSGTFAHCVPTGATEYGFYVTRNSVARVDYCIPVACAVGLSVDMASRANSLGSDYRRNGVGVRTSGAGEWINAGSIFNIGTADANTVAFENFGVGRETRLYSQSARNEFAVGNSWSANPTYEAPVDVTGTTANTLVYTGTALGEIPAGFFDKRGKRIRVEVWGQGTLSADANVKLYAAEGSTTFLLSDATLKSGMAGTGFKIEFIVRAESIAAQSTMYAVTAESKSRAGSSAKTVNFAVEKNFRLYAQLGNSADLVRINSMETFLMG